MTQKQGPQRRDKDNKGETKTQNQGQQSVRACATATARSRGKKANFSIHGKSAFFALRALYWRVHAQHREMKKIESEDAFGTMGRKTLRTRNCKCRKNVPNAEWFCLCVSVFLSRTYTEKTTAHRPTHTHKNFYYTRRHPCDRDSKGQRKKNEIFDL